MRLRVLVPSGILLETDAVKVVAEAVNGCFCLLPRHIDFVTVLVPGLFAYETSSGVRDLMALDAGTLVKKSDEVLVAVRHAVRAPGRHDLSRAVREDFAAIDERERQVRTAGARLETEIVRKFLEHRKAS